MNDRSPDVSVEKPDITCEEVLTFLWAYLAGELPPERVAEFERHLSGCPSCVAYIETYRQTIELSRGSVQSEAEAELPEDLVRAVMAARRKG
jgi:anti-sigma factor RsiW